MYIELKIVTVLSYFIFVYNRTVNINTLWKLDFIKNWYVIDHCKGHIVFQHTKIHEEELNFSKKFFSLRPV
jgi:presenilin-like A22 family membrane protease